MPEVAASQNDAGLSKRQGALIVILVAALWMLWLASVQSPIPTGKANREQARPFLKKLFPQRILEPEDSVTAPVAAIFAAIRSEEPDLARQVIDFAAQQQFGYAAPYVIERLGSDDPDLEQAAQAFLRQIAGADYGPDAQSWQAWWRNPPQRWLGLSVPQTTFLIAVPLLTGLAAVGLLWFGGTRPMRGIVELGTALLVLAWFTGCISTMMWLVGDPQTCYFGVQRITYFADHGAVIGLEGTKTGGIALYAGLLLVYLLVPFIAAISYAAWVIKRTANEEPGERGVAKEVG
jgi:hypothetical protein